MKQYRGVLFAGVMVLSMGLFGAVVFAQMAHPVHAVSVDGMPAGSAGTCPATGARVSESSCQDIHSQFMIQGTLTADDYARILREASDGDMVTCWPTEHNTTLARLGYGPGF